MYMGEPHSVAAIMLLWRYRAKPKSAARQKHETHVLLSLGTHSTIVGLLGMPGRQAQTVNSAAARTRLEPGCSGRHPSQRLTYFDADAANVGLLATCVRQQNVLGLQISVDDAFAVEDAHGSSDLLEEDPQRVLSERPLS